MRDSGKNGLGMAIISSDSNVWTDTVQVQL